MGWGCVVLCDSDSKGWRADVCEWGGYGLEIFVSELLFSFLVGGREKCEFLG